ncbi:DUF2141 domain-containing protein [Emticicia sp. BO119]|uniref:DUF2141 domain-containing protein n=1 Tax=Emticicia sp. BO119 TaxID=2757768 RepID=UPI0015F0EA19|nr:DUF2141 domain-containing protein [Emticicia sp. BO119]MBA4851945.1 DUF2141 domain-containing protein [Emticicia sp. BO119]
MKNLIKSIVLITISGFITTFSFAQSKYSVTVVVKGMQQRHGKIYASITNDTNAFPRGGGIKSAIAEVTPEGEMSLKFDNVLEGKYAIVLYQDLNDNKQLDMNGEMPAEPFGFSNVTMLMGPPSFEQCAFDLNENKTIAIGLMAF